MGRICRLFLLCSVMSKAPSSVNSATDLPQSRITATDRLGFTLFIAALVHIALILGVGFTMESMPEPSKSLEITLASFASEKAPKEADFLAQANQMGSGTLEKATVPTTTEKAEFQDNKINEVQVESSPKPVEQTQTQKTVVATFTPQLDKVNQQPTKQQQDQQRPTPLTDQERLAAEIASLEAALEQQRQEYAKRPRVSRQNAAATKRDMSAGYRDEWRKTVERIGNLNYPEQARRQKIHGSLRMLVIIRSNGSIDTVRILESSGHPVLDKAAQDSVRLSAPFSPFTGELAANFDQIEIIRTWRFERGDILSSAQ